MVRGVTDEYAGRCGSCGAFTRVRTDAQGNRVGECALNVFPPPLSARSTCTRYRPRGGVAPPPPARVAGQPRSKTGPPAAGPVRRDSGGSSPSRPDTTSFGGAPFSGAARPRLNPLPQEIDIDMDIGDFRRVLREVLSEELGIGDVELGARWEGGELILKPGKPGTAEKRIPLDAFFHKIVMLRDKLRVLEQKINAHGGLSDADKVQLQAYVTGCYGSLTTFNALFNRREDWFVGAGKDED
jgi:hypothetical protein